MKCSVLLFILLCVALLCMTLPMAAEVTIKPATPPGVAAGACIDFSANAAGKWSVSCSGKGCQAGTIDASTGHYCAPAVVHAKNQSRGCQLLPNDNVYNTPVNTLPVDPRSAYWLQRVADDHPSIPSYHNFKMGPEGFHDVAISNSTPTQTMHFVYGGPWQNTVFPHVQPPDAFMQNGWSQDVAAGLDRHLFQINRDTCVDYEIYNDFFDFPAIIVTAGNPTKIAFRTRTIRAMQNPIRVYVGGGTGAWAGINGSYMATVVEESPGVGGIITVPFNSEGLGKPSGEIKVGSSNPAGLNALCNQCNSASGVQWPASSNALLNGTDAAGSPISATSAHAEEWWNVTQQGLLDPACNCVTLGHALRTTLSNAYISPRDLWPSISGTGVTGGHPNMQLLSATTGGTTTFTISENNCNGKSLLQCQLPCPGFSYSVGCQFHIVIRSPRASAGKWLAANGNWVATAVSDHSFSIPLDSKGFPALAAGATFMFDWLPYGARIVLKPSFNVAEFCSNSSLNDKCPYEKVLLNTLQVYGMMVLDGTVPGANWESGYENMEFFPDPLMDAMKDLRTNPALGYKSGGLEPYLQVVDESSLQVSKNQDDLGVTNNGRVTVTFTAAGHGSASVDVNLQGTTVGVQPERIAIPSGVTSQIDAWINGNANRSLTYTMSPAVSGASVSNSGLITAPRTLAAMESTRIVICSAADRTQCAYEDVFFIPTSSDGAIRLNFGQHAKSYTDHSGNLWWGQIVPRPFNTNYEIGDGINFAYLNGTWSNKAAEWAGTTDAQLYAQSTSSYNDTNLTIALPNGNYKLTLYGEPGFGTTAAGKNVFDVEIGGVVRSSYNDGYLLAGGTYKGYTKTYTATVTNSVLHFNGRIRETSTYGMSWSSLLIVPVAKSK